MTATDVTRRRISPVTVRMRDSEGAAMNDPVTAEQATAELALAFAPLHKRAFGVALGVALGLLLFLLTALVVLRGGEAPFPIGYLGQYLYGYTVSWRGAFVALGWGFVVGFVGGWFFAFVRNLTVAISLFAIRTRAQLSATRDFLDHI
jgi:hypothetical protein